MAPVRPLCAHSVGNGELSPRSLAASQLCQASERYGQSGRHFAGSAEASRPAPVMHLRGRAGWRKKFLRCCSRTKRVTNFLHYKRQPQKQPFNLSCGHTATATNSEMPFGPPLLPSKSRWEVR